MHKITDNQYVLHGNMIPNSSGIAQIQTELMGVNQQNVNFIFEASTDCLVGESPCPEMVHMVQMD